MEHIIKTKQNGRKKKDTLEELEKRPHEGVTSVKGNIASTLLGGTIHIIAMHYCHFLSCL